MDYINISGKIYIKQTSYSNIIRYVCDNDEVDKFDFKKFEEQFKPKEIEKK
jgi:hypothetical protein